MRVEVFKSSPSMKVNDTSCPKIDCTFRIFDSKWIKLFANSLRLCFDYLRENLKYILSIAAPDHTDSDQCLDP